LDPYCEDLKAYLAELETRLFSEGLHTLGAPPTPDGLRAYLVRPAPRAPRQRRRRQWRRRAGGARAGG
jgi:cobalamin biosynthesis Mg chelatase CobN